MVFGRRSLARLSMRVVVLDSFEGQRIDPFVAPKGRPTRTDFCQRQHRIRRLRLDVLEVVPRSYERTPGRICRHAHRLLCSDSCHCEFVRRDVTDSTSIDAQLPGVGWFLPFDSHGGLSVEND